MKNNKIMMGLTSTALLASIVSPVAVSASTQFKDIPNNHWSEEAVNFGVEKGYINGVTSDMFGFGRSITRQDASVMIANALYGGANNIPKGTPEFSDVSSNSYAANAIAALVDLGAINGYSDGTFKPKKTITREEFAAILVSAFSLERDYDVESPVFSDVSNDRWSKNAIDTITQYGINGVGNGKFAPTNLVTREQAAQFIYNPYLMESPTTPSSAYSAFSDSVELKYGIFTDFDTIQAEDIQIDGLEVKEIKYYDLYEYLYVSTSEQVGGKEYHVKIKGQDTGLSFTGVAPIEQYFDLLEYFEEEGNKYFYLYNVQTDKTAGNIDWTFVNPSDLSIPGLTIKSVEPMYSIGAAGGSICYEGQVEEGKEYTVFYKGEDTGYSFVGWNPDNEVGYIEN